MGTLDCLLGNSMISYDGILMLSSAHGLRWTRVSSSSDLAMPYATHTQLKYNTSLSEKLKIYLSLYTDRSS